MFHKILLPVDLTDRHERALGVAAGLAGRTGEVILLHVIEEIAGLPRQDEPAFYARLERKAAAHLERLAAALTGQGVLVRREVVVGTRLTTIVNQVRGTGADLIVLTSPRPDPDNPAAGWGSLSHRAGLICPCPVLLVK